jgi:hypothetical protein
MLLRCGSVACIFYLSACSSSILTSPATVSTPSAPVPLPTTFSDSLNSTSDFIGASIINYWPMPMHNDGIVGETTSQVLARFSTAVLNNGYQRVIILCGTNDIIQNTSNLTTELTGNLQVMARIAADAGIKVVLSELPPATSNGVDLNASVNAVNSAIIALAARDGYLLVDYNTPMVGHPEYFVDGVHPNAAGYAVMEKALAGVVLH